MDSRRHALSLAAVLAATTLTGSAAVLGLVHRHAQGTAQPVVVQQQAPQQRFSEQGDD